LRKRQPAFGADRSTYLKLIFDATTFNRDDGPDQIYFDRILALGHAGRIILVAPLSVREDVSDTRTQSRADQGSDNSVRSSDTGWAPMRKSLNGIVRAVPGWRCGRDRLDYCPKATVFSTLSGAHLTGATTGISARWAR
jgi:hypothetical protein